MNKKSFKLATQVGVFVVVTPLAWYVYDRHSGLLQFLFTAALFGVAYLLKKLVYEPMRDKLPDESGR